MLCRLFPFDDAKIWRFFRWNKNFAVFCLSLLRQLRCFATNQRHSGESRRKSSPIYFSRASNILQYDRYQVLSYFIALLLCYLRTKMFLHVFSFQIAKLRKIIIKTSFFPKIFSELPPKLIKFADNKRQNHCPLQWWSLVLTINIGGP